MHPVPHDVMQDALSTTYDETHDAPSTGPAPARDAPAAPPAPPRAGGRANERAAGRRRAGVGRKPRRPSNLPAPLLDIPLKSGACD